MIFNMPIPKGESCGALWSLFWYEISLSSWQFSHWAVSYLCETLTCCSFGIQYSFSAESWAFSFSPLPPCDQLLQFPWKKIMLLKDFKYPIFSVFLFWRNRMRKQTFSIVVLYGMSSGTLCCLDLPILPAASLLVPLFVLWVRIRPCLVLFWHSKEYCVPCICCSHPSMCLKLVVDYKSWPNSRSLKCDKRIWSCRGKEKLSAHFKATENWIVAFPAVIHKMFSNASGVGQSLMLSYFN